MLVGLGVVLVGEGGDVLAVAVEGDASGEDLCNKGNVILDCW